MDLILKPPAVTMLYAALAGILLVALALNVVRFRLGRRVGLGFGADGILEQPVRVHANFAENAPVFLVLLLLAELAGLAAGWLHAAGVVFLAARLAHAFGLGSSPGRTPGRFLGSAGTWTVILALSGYLLVQTLGH
ncbi:MAG TPA: MAPEG family protein [Steroidobacteraceae bacterium]|nr:MAPEG family protein [Steroidobacteraceae bacterium]